MEDMSLTPETSQDARGDRPETEPQPENMPPMSVTPETFRFDASTLDMLQRPLKSRVESSGALTPLAMTTALTEPRSASTPP